MSVSINGTGGLTFSDSSVQSTAATGFGFKNRIINGAMVIAQRGTSAFTSSGEFGVDRFKQTWSGVGVLSTQQSSDVPAGFVNSLKVTTSTIDASVTGGDFYQIEHMIEGYNAADFNWGFSNAQAVTVSFWVKASQTGTYSASLANSDGSRVYPSYITINSANTWEYKTIVVPATTAGTWLTTNGVGVGLRIGFAYGSTYNGATANAWMTTTGFTNAFVTPTNNMMGTLNATFYITGVQLEKGSTATSFDYRPYGTELALCQRYYQSIPDESIVFTATVNYSSWLFPVTMRATPTVTIIGSTNGTQAVASTTTNGFFATNTGTTGCGYTAAAEL